MPLLGGANTETHQVSDGIGLARLSRTQCSGRACTTGISVAEASALVFKTAVFPETAQKSFGKSDRNPTAGITGERRPTNSP